MDRVALLWWGSGETARCEASGRNAHNDNVSAFTCSRSTIDQRRANGTTRLDRSTVIQLLVASRRRWDLLSPQFVRGANNGTSTKTALCVSAMLINFFLTSVL